MSPEFWAIIGVGAALVYVNYVAADENEKRLDRIIHILINIEEDVNPRQKRD